MIPQAIKDLLKSKKFWLTIGGSAICTALGLLHISPEIIGIVGGLFGVNIGGQALVDSKKNG